MKAKGFAIIEKQLEPFLPHLIIRGKMTLIPPARDFLRAVYFENSSGTKEFYVQALFLPLFTPLDHINFNHGHRLRRNGRTLWEADEPNLIKDLYLTIREQA